MYRVLVSILLLTITVSATFPSAAFAQSDPANEACKGITATGGTCGTGAETEVNNTIETVVEILLFVVGVAAVLMLIVGGLRYIVSGGDPQAASNAKNTILYAVIGLIVAILGYALVQFVFSALVPSAS